MNKKPVVMVFGTFDMLHQGHCFFLRQARQLGHTLLVIIARDRNVLLKKGQKPLWDEKKRQRKLRTFFQKATNVHIYLGHKQNFTHHLLHKKPDIVALGYDQVGYKWLKDKITTQQLPIQIVRVQSHYPEKYKTSLLRQKIHKHKVI